MDVILRDDPDLPRRLLGALSRGRIVGLFVDQSTSLPSRRHGDGVVFGSCHEMRGDRLCIEIERVSLPPGTDLDGALGVINGHVERAVRAFPDQWVWMHERWKRRVT